MAEAEAEARGAARFTEAAAADIGGYSEMTMMIAAAMTVAHQARTLQVLPRAPSNLNRLEEQRPTTGTQALAVAVLALVGLRPRCLQCSASAANVYRSK